MMLDISFSRFRARWLRQLWPLAVLLVAGCASLPQDDPIVPPTGRQVQQQAWQTVQQLTAELSTLDANRNPGAAALVEDLRAAANAVDAGTGGNFQALQPATLITKNPHYWQALLEMDPSDSTLPVLEGMVLAAAGEIEQAADVLMLVRAGPLMDEALDEPAALQAHTIDAWRLQTPGIDIVTTRGLPPDQRWEPLKRLQAMYPDSAAVALEVIKMRCDLAKVEMVAAGDGQHMRDKIIAAEPQAMQVLEAHRPLWAGLLQATGEAGDAARRIAEMITPDGNGELAYSTDDLAQLVADLNRIGAPDWALRALRLQMGRKGTTDATDLAAMRELLTQVLDATAAERLVTAVESRSVPPAVLHPASAEPTGAGPWPVDPLIAGHYEREKRTAQAVLTQGTPAPAEERTAIQSEFQAELTLGDYGRAEAVLNQQAGMAIEPLDLALQRLQLATARDDATAVASALAAVEKIGPKLKLSYYQVGVAEIRLGRFKSAADAMEVGLKNSNLTAERRAYAAYHAFGAARLAGENPTKLLTEGLALVKPTDWVARLLSAQLGEVDREQLLIEAADGRDYTVRGRRCEAYFALAFAPNQTPSGRRADLEACVRTGMIGYIEYEFARAWLLHEGVTRLTD